MRASARIWPLIVSFVLDAEVDLHPKSITVRVARDRLSMGPINATCEDNLIRQYQPLHIRVRIERARPGQGRLVSCYLQIPFNTDNLHWTLIG